MRIALIHTRLLHRGGLEKRLLSYIREFDRLGHEVTVIVYKHDEGIPLPEKVRVVRMNLSWVPKPFREIYFNRKLCAFLSANKFDLAISMARNGCSDVFIAGGNHLGYLELTGKNYQSSGDRRQVRMDSVTYSGNKVILTASGMLKEQIMRFHEVNENKVFVLHPPTDEKIFNQGLKSRKDEFRKEFSIPEDRSVYLFISSNHKLKGLDILLKVFNQLDPKEYHLVIAGPEPQAELPANVQNVGYIKETWKLYAAADYFVYPSRYDAFGQVVSESIFCGTPVIISGNTGAKDVVSENEGVVVHSFDVEEWKKSVVDIRDKSFNISSDFAQKNSLTLNQHIQNLLKNSGKQ